MPYTANRSYYRVDPLSGRRIYDRDSYSEEYADDAPEPRDDAGRIVVTGYPTASDTAPGQDCSGDPVQAGDGGHGLGEAPRGSVGPAKAAQIVV